MINKSNNNWNSIVGIVSELKSCDTNGEITASLAMAYICIDSLANLSRQSEDKQATRKDFIGWVDKYLKGHPSQPYQYRGIDVYAARCAMLHTYGSEASLHKKDSDILMYGYSDGGKHYYNPNIEKNLVIIGVRSLVDDIVNAVDLFLENCQKDELLRQRVEVRLSKILSYMPLPKGV